MRYIYFVQPKPSIRVQMEKLSQLYKGDVIICCNPDGKHINTIYILSDSPSLPEQFEKACKLCPRQTISVLNDQAVFQFFLHEGKPLPERVVDTLADVIDQILAGADDLPPQPIH